MLARFGSLISPYVPPGHQSGSALWLELCNIWASFNLCYRYIDDLIVFNKKKFLDYLKEIYPSQRKLTNQITWQTTTWQTTFIIDGGGRLSTRLYAKRDDFDFHIVNFPFLSSNIPSGPSYGVYISQQLIRYSRCCSHYDDSDIATSA